MAKKIDLAALKVIVGSGYPKEFRAPCEGRSRQRLGNAAKLTQFGVNRLVLKPGAWSSQRHWHTHEDEFVCVLEGTVVLVTDDGEETLRPGDCAGFKAGAKNGHHLQNRTKRDAVVLEIGGRNAADVCHYSDIDLIAQANGSYTRRDGGTMRRAKT